MRNSPKNYSRMASSQSTFVHLVAGGVGGTVGAVLTCPLEVIKTRLQSSVPTFITASTTSTCVGNFGSVPMQVSYQKPTGVMTCLQSIIRNEGVSALFRGLGPTLVGVAPSRAIYFSFYATAKMSLNKSGRIKPDSKLVHMGSACTAGLLTSTITSPLWVIKTRLQLDNRSAQHLWQLIMSIYKKDGIKGFYRGLTASYVGVTETCIHFVIYEHIKSEMRNHNVQKRANTHKNAFDFVEFMLAAATSKCIASTVAYPHEVIRTRLRQQELDGTRKYHSFFQAFKKIGFEEGYRGLYGGLGTHLIRQIPNTAILFLTYEAIVSFLCKED